VFVVKRVPSVDRIEGERSVPRAIASTGGSVPLVSESHGNSIGRQIYLALERDRIQGAAIGGKSDFFDNAAVFIQKYRPKAKVMQTRVAECQISGKPDITRQVYLPLLFGIAVFDGEIVAFPLSGVSGLFNGETIFG